MSSDCEGRTQEDIGKDIEEWRARAGLTQLQLALIIGLKNDRQYRRICCDCDYEFPRKSLRLLAKLMKVTVDFLTPDAHNVSLVLDVKIFFKTISTVLKRENIYTN